MKVRDITSVIEEFAPLGIQESWDNGGLCIGSPDDEVHGVLVGFDCTPELIAEAVRRGLDMVVTHHPLIFGGLKRIVPGDPVSDAVSAAIRGHVAVYASHTSADKVIGGVSGAMARRLGLEDIRILDEEEGGVGLGAVGELPRPMEAEEALEYLDAPILRYGAPFTPIPFAPTLEKLYRVYPEDLVKGIKGVL